MKTQLTVIAICATLVPNISLGMEGEWFGGHSIGGRPVSISVRAYGDVGLVETQGRGAETMPSDNCSYVVEFAGASATGYLVTSRNRATDCPQTAEFTFAENPDDTLDIETNVGLIDFDVSLVTPASAHGDTLPYDGFDLTGVRPGQTRAEIESLLAERGWQEREDLAASASTDTFSVSGSVYTSGAPEILTLFGVMAPPDVMKVAYGARLEGVDPAEDIAITVTRDLSFGEANPVALSAFEASLLAKYGDRHSPNGADRAYLPDGTVDTQARRQAENYSGADGCTSAVAEHPGNTRRSDNSPIVVFYSGGGIGRPAARAIHNFGPACGGRADINITPQDSLVARARMELLDDAVGMAELWTQRKLSMQARLRPQIETLKAASETSVPDL